MKKAILLLILTISFCAALKAQTHTFKDTAKYNKIVVIQPGDYQALIGIASSYRNLTTYSPFVKPEEKLQEQASIDQFLNGLSQRVKLDSVKIIPPKTK